jgi:hypothetical protein
MKPPPKLTFFQLVKEHFRERGSLLVADAILMLFAFVAPAVVLIGLKILAGLGSSNRWLDYSETTDSVLLFLMILTIGIDSLLKLIALTVSGWQTWNKSKPKTDS